MERADIAIIGTGPGGVSAALTAKVRNKNIFRDLTQFVLLYEIIILFLLSCNNVLQQQITKE